MSEKWRDAPGWPNYRVSDQGRVWRCAYGGRKGRYLSTNGRYLSFKRGSQFYDVSVAQLVLLAFKGTAPVGKPNALHRDDDRTNNRISNLYWGSKRDNWEDAVKNGRWDRSDDLRRKVSSSLKGHTVSAKTRAKISASFTGRKGHVPTPETLAKISGENHWAYGKPVSAKTRLKMSESAKRRRRKTLPGEAVAPLPEGYTP